MELREKTVVGGGSKGLWPLNPTTCNFSPRLSLLAFQRTNTENNSLSCPPSSATSPFSKSPPIIAIFWLLPQKQKFSNTQIYICHPITKDVAVFISFPYASLMTHLANSQGQVTKTLIHNKKHHLFWSKTK